jgi:hypothetical protein
MTVTFTSDSYYGVKNDIEAFEKQINNVVSVLNINILPCTIDSVLSYIQMNYTGELKRVDSNIIFDKKNYQIAHEVMTTQSGHITSGGREGVVYTGKIYPSKLDDEITRIYTDMDGEYKLCIDFQSFTDEEKDIYKYEINNVYCNDRMEYDLNMPVNMTCVLVYIQGKKKINVHEASDRISQFYEENKILMMHGSGREETIFKSSCTLGLVDYHSMVITNTGVISEFLM